MNPLEVTTTSTFSKIEPNQSDHDAILTLTVVCQNILQEMKGIKDDIKEMKATASANQTILEDKIESSYNSLATRVRTLEDQQTRNNAQYIPTIESVLKDVSRLKDRVDTLESAKQMIFGGWKGIALIFGTLTGIASFIYALINISTHLH